MSDQPTKNDETVPGGLYKGTDGTWHDANGNIIKVKKPTAVPPVVAPEEAPAEEEVKKEEAPTPAAAPSSAGEYARPSGVAPTDEMAKQAEPTNGSNSIQPTPSGGRAKTGYVPGRRPG